MYKMVAKKTGRETWSWSGTGSGNGNGANIAILLLLIVIFTCGCVYQLFYSRNSGRFNSMSLSGRDQKNTYVTKWINKGYGAEGNHGEHNPSAQLQILLRDIGHPSTFDSGRGGCAIWNRVLLKERKIPLSRLIVVDEQIPMTVPFNHTCFVYASIECDIPTGILDNVLAVSKTLTYNEAKKELTALSYSLETCSIMLALATSVAVEKETIQNIENDEILTKKLLASIPTSANYDINIKNKMFQEIDANVELMNSAAPATDGGNTYDWGDRRF